MSFLAPRPPDPDPTDDAVAPGGSARALALLDLDEDRRFCCRATIRSGTLRRSIAERGQQQPVIVRPSPTLPGRFQLIAGFRRVAALREGGAKHVIAQVYDPLDDATAWRIAIADNARRQTLTDLDRAHLVWTLEREQRDQRASPPTVIRDGAAHGARASAGGGGGQPIDVEALLELTPRQRRNIRSLLTLPEPLRDALEEQLPHFTATHALALRAVIRQGVRLDLPAWVERVALERLSVRQLKRLLARPLAVTQAEDPVRLIDDSRGDPGRTGIVYIAPRRINLRRLRAEDRQSLAADGERLLAWVRAEAGREER